MVVVHDARRTSVRHRSVRHAGEPECAEAAVDDDAVRPEVGCDDVRVAVAIEVPSVFEFFAGTGCNQPLVLKGAVCEIAKQREGLQFVNVIARDQDLGRAIAIEIANQNRFVRR